MRQREKEWGKKCISSRDAFFILWDRIRGVGDVEVDGGGEGGEEEGELEERGEKEVEEEKEGGKGGRTEEEEVEGGIGV